MMNDEQGTRDVLAGEPGRVDVGQSAGPASAEDRDERDGRDPGEQDETAAKGRFSFLTEMVVLFAVALTIALLIKTFVVQPFFIPSGSMEDTLLIGDKVLVNKLVYHLRPIQRGDIIVFNGSGSWLSPTKPAPASSNPLVRAYDDTIRPVIHSFAGLFGTAPGQTDYIKRVVGVPGDHVVCCNAQGLITVNGVALHEQSYVISGAKPSQGAFNIVVPPGRLWVMGDNRPESADSRLHDCAYTYLPAKCVPYDRDGTVPEDRVIGRAFMIVWPASRFRILPIPATFTQPGLDRGTAQSSHALARPVQVRQSPPYLPLAGGVLGAVPLTLLERRLRLRVLRKRRARRAGPASRDGQARGERPKTRRR